MDITAIKEEIRQAAAAKSMQFENVADYIFVNPELAFHEYKAQKILCDLLSDHGFTVKKPACSLPTSFEAAYIHGDGGKRIAFMAEYDALPEIGHACGHHLIGTSSVGAAILLKDRMQKHNINGTLKVIGTPAEESVGGKVIMLREGVFQNLDAAMILHPTRATMPDDISFASLNMEYHFFGKAAHAAAYPWKGANALSGVIQMFNAVDSMRIHLRDHTRVHGIITNGGTAHNIISETAAALFNIRALEYDYLQEVITILENCAKGAALATNTRVEIRQRDELLKEIRNNKALVEIFRNNMRFIREPFMERDLKHGIGSTDVGNVTHELPAIQGYVGLKEGIGTHTAEFAEVAGGPEGKAALSKAVQILAMSGLDVLTGAKLE